MWFCMHGRAGRLAAKHGGRFSVRAVREFFSPFKTPAYRWLWAQVRIVAQGPPGPARRPRSGSALPRPRHLARPPLNQGAQGFVGTVGGIIQGCFNFYWS